MRKTILAILFFTTPCALKAQYFHHLYGTSINESTNDGIVVNDPNNNNGEGYFMVGTHVNSSGYEEITITQTNEDGTVYNSINTRYTLGFLSATLRSYGQQCIEIPGGGFGVIADYGGPINGLEYMHISSAGTLTRTNLFNTTTYEVNIKEFIVASNGTSDAYAMGELVNINTGRRDIFAISIDISTSTPTVNWFNKYHIVTPSPFNSSSDSWVFDMDQNPTTGEIIGVGSIYADNKTDFDAAIYFINPLLGTLNNVKLHTYPQNQTGDEEFKTIKVYGGEIVIGADVGTAPLGYEYVLSYFTMSGVAVGSKDYLIAYSAPNPPYSSGGVAKRCVDIQIELEPGASFETVYQLREVTNSTPTNKDWVVNKFQRTVTSKNFTYVNTDGDDIPASLEFDVNSSGVNDLMIFGTNFKSSGNGISSTSSYDEGIMRTSSTGSTVTQNCDPESDDDEFESVTHSDDEDANWITNALTGTQSLSVQSTNMSDKNICSLHSFSVPVYDKYNLNDVQVSPNPVISGVSTATIHLESDRSEEVQVVIYDMMGREYYRGAYIVSEGDNKLEISLPTLQMTKGMYTLKVSGITINRTTRLLIE